MDNSVIKGVMHNKFVRSLGIVALGALFIYCTNYFGFWWFTILVGIVSGSLIRQGRAATTFSLLMSGLGWGGGLVYQSFFLPVTRTASLIAGIIGLDSTDGWIIIIATIFIGVVLCESGTWFGSALRSFTTGWYSSMSYSHWWKEGRNRS